MIENTVGTKGFFGVKITIPIIIVLKKFQYSTEHLARQEYN